MAAWFLACTSVFAQPIVVELATTSGEPLSARITGSDITTVMNTVIARQDELAKFVGTEFTASVTYLGVPLAINLQIAPDAKSAVIDIPVINFSQTFTATSPDDLQHQIETFARTDGSSEIAELRRVVNKTSTAGITDGNPNATTALFANVFFDAFGLHPTMGTADPDAARWSFTHQLQGGDWRGEGIDGRLWIADVRIDHRLTNRTSLTMVLPATYMETGGAKTVGGGVALGLGHDWLGAALDDRWSAHSALFAGAMLRGSEELAAGGALWAYGATSSIRQRLTPALSWGVAGEFCGFAGIPMDYDGFELDNVVDQQIVKVGLPVQARLSEHVAAEAHWTRTFFLQSAAVDSYDALGAGLNWTWGRAGRASIGYESRHADRFRSDLWQAQFGWGF